jgi:hypothetical protein
MIATGIRAYSLSPRGGVDVECLRLRTASGSEFAKVSTRSHDRRRLVGNVAEQQSNPVPDKFEGGWDLIVHRDRARQCVEISGKINAALAECTNLGGEDVLDRKVRTYASPLHQDDSTA